MSVVPATDGGDLGDHVDSARRGWPVVHVASWGRRTGLCAGASPLTLVLYFSFRVLYPSTLIHNEAWFTNNKGESWPMGSLEAWAPDAGGGPQIESGMASGDTQLMAAG